MNSEHDTLERLHDLLVAKSLIGLSVEEDHELTRLLLAHPDVDSELYESASAVAELALLPRHLADMPLHVVERIRAIGDHQNPVVVRSKSPRFTRETLAWFTAAVCLLFALLTTLPGSVDHRSRRTTILQRNDSVTVNWTVADPSVANSSGDIVWNLQLQEGYMTFRNLPPNGRDHQYQLWIFDAERDERYPVDGGVFDIPSGEAEVIVPIRAKLPIHRATLFAVTVEKPGGVVVSDRKRLPLLAKAE